MSTQIEFWKIQESYPGLQARYDVGVVPATDRKGAEQLARDLNLSPNADCMDFHVSPAEPDEIAKFLDDALSAIERAKGLKILIPYFDEHLRYKFP